MNQIKTIDKIKIPIQRNNQSAHFAIITKSFEQIIYRTANKEFKNQIDQLYGSTVLNDLTFRVKMMNLLEENYEKNIKS